MASLHSLVLVKAGPKFGWMAPAECDEDSGHYIAYVIPLDDSGMAFDSYDCEVVRTGNADQLPGCVSLLRKGQGQYSFRLADTEFWFHEKPGVDGRKRPYIGQLEHADFSRSMVEIVPEDHRQLDQLCEKSGIYIVGRDPFIHYRKAGAPLSRTSTSDATFVSPS